MKTKKEFFREKKIKNRKREKERKQQHSTTTNRMNKINSNTIFFSL
jgi:hypothetical protein